MAFWQENYSFIKDVYETRVCKMVEWMDHLEMAISKVFWKCYEYGDDLVQIFEFIDDQRAKSVRDILIPDSEATEEFIDKHGSIVRLMENKRKTVEEFIKKGESLMEDEKSPKFLETHVSKLKEAWTVANEEAKKRKNALADNMDAWKFFEEKRVDCSKTLDMADNELKSIKKNFNMERAPVELTEKMKIAATMRFEIEELFGQTDKAFITLSIFAPDDKKKELEVHVVQLKERLEVLTKIDQALADLFQFNKELVTFDATLTELDTWITGRAQEKIANIRQPDPADTPPDPEDRVTKAMELLEDLLKKIAICSKAEEKKAEIFPAEGKKMSKEAKEFVDRMKSCRDGLTKLDEEVQAELNKFSIDVKYFADYQCGVRSFYPWLLSSEEKVTNGIDPPADLVSACNLLGECKTFQDDCEARLIALDNANVSAGKMTYHDFAEKNIIGYRVRWDTVHIATTSWVDRMTNLVECWNSLDGRVVELSSWVAASNSGEPAADGLSIEKLENHLQTLKENFKEKEKMIETLKISCGPKGNYPTVDTKSALAKRESAASETAPAEREQVIESSEIALTEDKADSPPT
eukprot:GFUD01069552.1.p1 GENE.GFUD01069552.1~~GFUD01069552.1.p1  ORF type:complete len:581 (-),score=157.70 GFUD01069552.1:119-1861(-)